MEMLITSPRYLRARIDVYRDAIARAGKDDPDIGILRSGVMRDKEEEHRLVLEKLSGQSYPNDPLSLIELTSFNTWFVLHPEKVCGQEIITTSREFPISVKGTKENIVAAIGHGTGDGRLILPVPFEWRIESFDPDTENFEVEYSGGEYKALIYDGGAEYFLEISQGTDTIESVRFDTVEEANLHLMHFMKAHRGPASSQSLELEALALEIELQISDL
jgi:hypothetical protein